MILTARITRARRSHGFTIVELLVTIGVIGVLVAISAPALFRVRTSAGMIQSLANLHDLSLSFALYASANQQRYPFPPRFDNSQTTRPEYGPIAWNPAGSLTDPHSAVLTFSPIWSMAQNWPGVMHSVATWPEHYRQWLSPGRLDSADSEQSVYNVRVSYHYSNSFVASPRVWSGTPGVSHADVGPIRQSDPAFPSQKVLFFDADRSYLRQAPTPADPRPLLFADGAAIARLDTDAAPGSPNPLNANSQSRYHNTPDGVLGRDF